VVKIGFFFQSLQAVENKKHLFTEKSFFIQNLLLNSLEFMVGISVDFYVFKHDHFYRVFSFKENGY